MEFQPDFRQIEKVLHNQRPERLPLYEHHIDTPLIEKAVNKSISIQGDKAKDYKNYYRQIIDFWKDMTIRIGDLYVKLWTEMLKRYDDLFVFYCMGDDLGEKF